MPKVWTECDLIPCLTGAGWTGIDIIHPARGRMPWFFSLQCALEFLLAISGLLLSRPTGRVPSSATTLPAPKMEKGQGKGQPKQKPQLRKPQQTQEQPNEHVQQEDSAQQPRLEGKRGASAAADSASAVGGKRLKNEVTWAELNCGAMGNCDFTCLAVVTKARAGQFVVDKADTVGRTKEATKKPQGYAPFWKVGCRGH